MLGDLQLLDLPKVPPPTKSTTVAAIASIPNIALLFEFIAIYYYYMDLKLRITLVD
jgi:hypothetical protein